MKLKPTTWGLVFTALLLGGAVYITQTQNNPQSAAVNPEQQPLFRFQEEDVQSLTVQTPLRSLKFQRDETGQWQMLEPEQTPASDASIAYLLNLLATGQSDRTISAPVSDREQYGLHQPLATVDVTLNNQETHQLILGGYDFNRSFIYAQADPAATAAEELAVLLVSSSFENAVNRPLAEWKQASEGEPGKSADSTATPAAAPPSETPPAQPPEVQPVTPAAPTAPTAPETPPAAN